MVENKIDAHGRVIPDKLPRVAADAIVVRRDVAVGSGDSGSDVQGGSETT